MAQSVSVEIDLKVSPQKLWGAIRDSASLFPKIMPSHFKSIEVIGDGNVGTIRKITYGEAMKGATHASEKIEVLDETNMTVTYTVIEGEILSIYKVFKPTFMLLPGADANSCRLSWTVEFEPAGNVIPPSEPIKEAAINTFKAVEAYLLTTA
uniref:Bet v I/Major latex protein domain-containing protein n=1 Tax=Picea sitchensis TaxID=3332 RepID=A9NMK0_PICSI|nr:unknown [Picea sitchensis]ABK25519.1 unknown [Picea sitchensis]ACN40121.1 unknown [Picea sitchensis]